MSLIAYNRPWIVMRWKTQLKTCLIVINSQGYCTYKVELQATCQMFNVDVALHHTCIKRVYGKYPHTYQQKNLLIRTLKNLFAWTNLIFSKPIGYQNTNQFYVSLLFLESSFYIISKVTSSVYTLESFPDHGYNAGYFRGYILLRKHPCLIQVWDLPIQQILSVIPASVRLP